MVSVPPRGMAEIEVPAKTSSSDAAAGVGHGNQGITSGLAEAIYSVSCMIRPHKLRA
jgi:hypothetical protein